MFIYKSKKYDMRDGITYYYYDIYEGNNRIGYVEIFINCPMYGTGASVVIEDGYRTWDEKDAKTVHYANEFESLLKNNIIQIDELNDLSNMTVCFGLNGNLFLEEE
jgi:hypothetical protein